MRVAKLLPLLACMAIVGGGLLAGCGGDKSTPQNPAELEDQLGFSRTGIVERQSRVEGAIRDCMKAQGFDYIPVDPFAQQAALTGKARISDEDFIKQFGYGISTLFGRGSTQADPNDRVRKTLGPADRAAYDRALFGDNPGVTFSEAVDSGDFTELGGCTKQASNEVFGGAAVLTALVERLDSLDERIVQDQRMVKATEKWAACMTSAGFQYTQPDDIDTDITKRFHAIVGAGVRPGATAPPAGASYDPAALATLQREEVKIGTTDLACEKKNITPVERVVRPQYEGDFRQQNSKLLARVRPVGG
jgi:hypothetical protein